MDVRVRRPCLLLCGSAARVCMAVILTVVREGEWPLGALGVLHRAVALMESGLIPLLAFPRAWRDHAAPI